MDLLKRNLAPILSEAWDIIDTEARNVLALNLAGRKLVDFHGPHGWRFAAVNTGAIEPIQDTQDGVHVAIRRVQPLIELRAPIALDIAGLDAVARGSRSPDLASVGAAAEKVAHAEDAAIFNGHAPSGIVGIVEASTHQPLQVAGVSDYPRAVLHAVDILRKAGVAGPYAVALTPRDYDDLFVTVEQGYPLAKQVQRQIEDGPLIRAPALRGAVVLSVRGGDYELTVGQDLSIGYAHHDERTVHLYLTESFTFRVIEPAAAVYLKHPGL
jgi:uncharacterized linocin/CFP29 family protein